MELVWQTNGFQECQPDLYSKMRAVVSLSLLLQPCVGWRVRTEGRGPPSTPDPLPSSLLASSNDQEGVSVPYLYYPFSLPFLFSPLSF